jgi:dTDP-L-rhamnose 4-epimerase
LHNRDLLIYEDGKQRRDFVHVSDVVAANMLVINDDRANYKSFNVGSGVATSVQQYAQEVINTVKNPVGMIMPGLFRRGDNRHSVSSIARLQALGWTPRISLQQILADYVAWIETIGGVPNDIPDALSHMRREGVVCEAHAKA